MFVAQAHSFAQQARLAITLAWVAGYTNILTVITCGAVSSHVSGTTSTLGRAAAEASWPLAAFSLFLLIAFVLGAVASGVCTETGRRRGWESIYVVPIAIEALLLAFFALGLEVHDSGSRQSGFPLYWLMGVACLAMGLQNATITHISSGVVRTTHVTGVLTDIGLESAQLFFWLFDRPRNVPPLPRRALARTLTAHPGARRLLLLGSIMLSFAIGGVLGTLAHAWGARWAMFPPVLFLAWIIYRDLTTPIYEIEPSALFAGTGVHLPPAIALYHMRREDARRGRVHRMPNLLAWADHLPPATRVVVLDLGEHSTFDPNSLAELRAAIARFTIQNRRLVIAGIGPAQLTRIHRAGASDIIDPANFCADLELAIARAITLAEPTSHQSPD